MFRSINQKKKKQTFRKVARTSTADDDEENEEEEDDDDEEEEDGGVDDDQTTNTEGSTLKKSVLLRRRKKNVAFPNKTSGRGGRVVRSFDVDDEEMIHEHSFATSSTNGKPKMKKRKRGLGFGGGGGGWTTTIENEKETETSDANLYTHSYGKEALEKLKAEQKRMKNDPKSASNTSSAMDVSHNMSLISDNAEKSDTILQPDALDTSGNTDPKIETNAEESFVALNGNDDVAFQEQYVHELEEEFEMNDSSMNAEESELWNEQIERRAGIKLNSSSSTKNSRISTSKLVSLDELSLNLQSTIKSIRTQQEELQNNINRRQADREHAVVDRKLQQETMTTAGTACEYYQRLRHDLTLWVGALRDLRQRVDPIQQTFLDMLKVQCEDADDEFRSFQDDCIAVLQEHKLLDVVFGRQPQIPTREGEPSIDEFGRDIGSQYIRDRNLRFQRRFKKYKETLALPKESNVNVLVNSMFEEQHNETERCQTLQEALRVALQDLNQYYTSKEGLKDTFAEWQLTNIEDYKQCYASLSLGDLMAIFLQTELCESSVFPVMVSSREVQDDPTLFLARLESFVNEMNGNDNDFAARALEKAILPILKVVLHNNNNSALIIFLSRTCSELLSHLVSTTMKCLHHLPKQISELQHLISKSIVEVLNAISIPILKEDLSQAVEGETHPNLELSIRFSTEYLVNLLQEMVRNMIVDWVPLLPIESEEGTPNGIQSVFTFINEKFLMLASSLDKKAMTGQDITPQLGKQAFAIIWEALQQDKRNILESPSLLLATMPLRAAGRAYQLDDREERT